MTRCRWIAVTFLCAVTVGCTSSTPHNDPSGTPAVLIWSKSLEAGSERWVEASRQRYGSNIVVVVCHGGGDPGGDWMFCPDKPRQRLSVQAGVEILRSTYPGRPIILITCNPFGKTIVGVDHVYYARRNVLVPPFKGSLDETRMRWWFSCGDIGEFSD